MIAAASRLIPGLCRAAVLALHARRSNVTLHRRSFGGMPILTRRILDYLLGETDHDGIALVAEDGDGCLRGIANVVATPDEDTDGEVAMLAEDDWQGRGIGTALLELLQEVAARSADGTPVVESPLDARATVRCGHREDRELHLSAELHYRGRVAAEADAVIVGADPQRLMNPPRD